MSTKLKILHHEVTAEVERRRLFANTALDIHSENLLFKEVFSKSCSFFGVIINQRNARFSIDFSQCSSIMYHKLCLESVFINLKTLALSIKTYKEGKESVMEYPDNGLGLDIKKHGDKIFRLNQTFHKDKESKWLGLFMIKNQIEAKGRKIWAESEENKEMKFMIKSAA